VSHTFSADRQPSRVESLLDGLQQSVDMIGRRSEEVEIAGAAIDHSGDHERGATGEGETVRFRQGGR
jgi:hypothetical protein